MTWPKGDQNPNGRLTPEQVRAIRRSTDKLIVIAAIYGISTTQAWRIRNRKQQKDVPDEAE